MIKIFLFAVFFLIFFLVVLGVWFVWRSPQFGASGQKIVTKKIRNSAQFRKGRFTNIMETHLATGNFLKMIPESFKKDGRIPEKKLPQKYLEADYFDNFDSNKTRITWFGHSTVLLEIDGKKIFIDPMLGNVPAPHPMMGSPRFNTQLPMDIADIPELDVVLISHDHYDHLDYGSIIALKDRVNAFYVPLGVEAHLIAWGVDPDKIFDLDWWESSQLGDITFTATPARHFSGRSLLDQNKTLWMSWVIASKNSRIFFGADSGYDQSIFEEIGQKHGPFDLAMLESGQYNKAWSQIHMMPEQTVQAGIDLDAKIIMPIHWGSFKLSFHPWKEPVERLVAAAKNTSIQVATPQVGESIILNEYIPKSKWWNE